MAKVTDRHASTDKPVILCDFSPPRGPDFDQARPPEELEPDFFCVAYNPGKAVRMDSAVTACLLGVNKAIFNLGTRDMNKLAIQTHLLGAHALGLKNVVVIQGDSLTERDRGHLKAVDDFSATGLIEAIRGMNEGKDYRGLALTASTDFCVGAAADLGRPLTEEAELTARKVAAGAHFLITQPIFHLDERERFLDLYAEGAGEPLDLPVFWGLQVLAKDGVVFSNVPETLRADLEKGREGADIAIELYEAFQSAGIRGIYLVPPIYRGGWRDYVAAARVVQAIRAR